MARDPFGNLIKTDIYGKRKSKRELKKEVLKENILKGKLAEEMYRAEAVMRGVEPEQSHIGLDFI